MRLPIIYHPLSVSALAFEPARPTVEVAGSIDIEWDARDLINNLLTIA